jgi:plasmid maintenance system killer protein
MIKSFRDANAKALFEQQDVPALRHIERVARRKLEALDAARQLGDLAAARGNYLEALKGNRLGNTAFESTDSIESASFGKRETRRTLR